MTTGTWAEAYVAGAWDPTTQVFTATEGRTPTAVEHERFANSATRPDFSVPCPEPSGGWPARNQEWPEEQVHMIPGYATFRPGKAVSNKRAKGPPCQLPVEQAIPRPATRHCRWPSATRPVSQVIDVPITTIAYRWRTWRQNGERAAMAM